MRLFVLKKIFEHSNKMLLSIIILGFTVHFRYSMAATRQLDRKEILPRLVRDPRQIPFSKEYPDLYDYDFENDRNPSFDDFQSRPNRNGQNRFPFSPNGFDNNSRDGRDQNRFSSSPNNLFDGRLDRNVIQNSSNNFQNRRDNKNGFDWNQIWRTPSSTPSPATSTVAVPGMETTPSACESRCQVTSQYDPICGDNNVTYSNRGRLECAQRCGRGVNILHPGVCSVILFIFGESL